jgi:heme/copper-type cytochrome/quinol oxidase subunit 2
MRSTPSKPLKPKRWIAFIFATVVVLAIAIALYLRERSTSGSIDLTGPLLLEARGKDRAWHFTYAGADGVLHTADDWTTVSELALVLGRKITVELRSDDYIYVFSCPELELKEIAVPELDYSLTFPAKKIGTYELSMDPMCGFRLPPGETMGTLKVLSEQDFRSWLDGSTATAPLPDR